MDVPDAPDPEDTAASQMQSNVQGAVASSVLNNYNQETPFGTVQYKKVGKKWVKGPGGEKIKVPKYKQVVTLSPGQQRLFDIGQDSAINMAEFGRDQIGRLSESLSTPFNLDDLPERETDWSEDRQRVEQAMFDRLNPEFERDEARTRARLAAQGLTPGGEAYDEDLDRHEDAVNRARLDIIAAGGAEQSRLFGMSEAARSAALREKLLERTQPLNEITALLSGTQIQMPEAYHPYQSGIDAAPIGDYIQSNYEQEMNSYNQMMANIFGLGRTAMSGLFGMAG